MTYDIRENFLDESLSFFQALRPMISAFDTFEHDTIGTTLDDGLYIKFVPCGLSNIGRFWKSKVISVFCPLERGKTKLANDFIESGHGCLVFGLNTKGRLYQQMMEPVISL